MAQNIIPDDMMFISKLEYEGLMQENEALRQALASKDAAAVDHAADELYTKILTLDKSANLLYIIRFGCEGMSKQDLVAVARQVSKLVLSAGFSKDNLVLVPATPDCSSPSLELELKCIGCKYKPGQVSWLDTLRSIHGSRLKPAMRHSRQFTGGWVRRFLEKRSQQKYE